jgi:hypothetical protein
MKAYARRREGGRGRGEGRQTKRKKKAKQLCRLKKMLLPQTKRKKMCISGIKEG